MQIHETGYGPAGRSSGTYEGNITVPVAQESITDTLSRALQCLLSAEEMAEVINGRLNGFRPRAVSTVADNNAKDSPPPNVRDLSERIANAAQRVIAELNNINPGI